MWALAVLVVTIFTFQKRILGLGLARIGLIIAVISLFLVALFGLSSLSAAARALATPKPPTWCSPRPRVTPSP
jgi:hypothetical protein